MPLEIELVPALSDNYVYIVRDTATGTVAVVDPAEPDPVDAALEAKGWKPTLIINTHHHGDHIGGNADLIAKYGCKLVGPAAESHRIPGMDQTVSEGDTISIGDEVGVVFETPGHTKGHISVHFPGGDALFAGDTLFALGCGRMFEGTPEEFWTSLSKLRALPDCTRVYCGHEYTQSNAKFALSVDPGNAALVEQVAEIDRKRAQGLPTVPSLLGDEKKANPFLRADDPALSAHIGAPGDAIAAFAEIRSRKDNF
jgi:hydroxyacylglutathione hydrolase